MNKLISIVVLGALALAVAGCGDPAPSTPIAPDMPTSSKGEPIDAGAVKAAEHGGAAGDRGGAAPTDRSATGGAAPGGGDAGHGTPSDRGG